MALGLDLAGVAGYRWGLVLVAVPLVIGSGLAVWSALRHSSNAVVWGIVAGVVGLTLTGALGARAPYSKGALEGKLDDLVLPFFEVRTQRAGGRSWCRPSCPRVERIYEVPDVGVQSTMVTVGLALEREEVVTQEDLRRIGPNGFLRVRSERLDVEVRVAEDEDGSVGDVSIRYLAKRP